MKREIEEHNYFVCITCADNKQIDAAKMMEHLKEKHQLSAPFKGQKQMLSHIDYSDSFSWSYQWTFENNVIANQFTLNKRRGGRIG